MRPKHFMAVYCADEERGRDLGFVLQTRLVHCCRVEIYSDTAALEDHLFDANGNVRFRSVVLAPAPDGGIAEQIDLDYLARHAEVAAFAIEVRIGLNPAWSPWCTRRVAAGDMGSLLAAIQQASERKRGPKKARNVNLTSPVYLPALSEPRQTA